jgi:circadian clock protein KaiB
MKEKTEKKSIHIVEDDNQKYILQLFVNGKNRSSVEAVKNAARICEEYLDERYDLQIIDIKDQPMLSIKEDIVATPTLIKKLPDPLRKLIGDLSDIDHVLMGLNLKKID